MVQKSLNGDQRLRSSEALERMVGSIEVCAMIFALCVKRIPRSCTMVIKFKVFKWVQSLMGLFLLSDGTARGPGGAKASTVHLLNVPCLYILIRNTCIYNFLLV